MESTNNIKVSVSVLCYKHAKYLRQCLDSILNQKVNFRYEIVIGDDCSNDGSAEIINEYKEKYPDIIVPLINEANLGASKNSFNIKLHCRGQYISSCEGDDFWINDQKLQKQVDFLDSHPEYSAVATNSVLVDPNGENPRISLLRWQVNRTYTLKDYLRNGMIIHGNTIMYRRHDLESDERYRKLRFAEPTMGDIISRVVFYDRGPIFVLPDVTHAHRSGLNDATSYSAQQKTKLLYYTKMYFRIVDNLTKYFDDKYNLTELKSNRLAAVLSCIYINGIKVDRNELREVFKSVSFRYRFLAYYRFFKRFVLNVIKKVGRKLNLHKII